MAIKRKHIHTIKKSETYGIFLNVDGQKIEVRNLMNHVMRKDVGKRIYQFENDFGEVWHLVETNKQMDDRLKARKVQS